MVSQTLTLFPLTRKPTTPQAQYGGPFCQDTGEGHFKVGTAPFSRRLAGLCRLSLTRGAAAGAT